MTSFCIVKQGWALRAACLVTEISPLHFLNLHLYQRKLHLPCRWVGAESEIPPRMAEPPSRNKWNFNKETYKRTGNSDRREVIIYRSNHILRKKNILGEKSNFPKSRTIYGSFLDENSGFIFCWSVSLKVIFRLNLRSLFGWFGRTILTIIPWW